MNDMKKIFLLHGWTYSIEKWQPFIELMATNGYIVEPLRIPGLTVSTDHVWTLDDYVTWLFDQLKDESKPIVIGHSNGGRIGLAFAVKYPDKLKQLFVVDGAGIYHNEPLLRLKRFAFGLAAKVGKNIIIAQRYRKWLYKLALVSDYEKATPIMQRTMANLIAVDLTPQLSNITTPTILIWGEKDKVTPVSDGQAMVKHISKSKLHIIKGARHSPHITHSTELCKIILTEIKI